MPTMRLAFEKRENELLAPYAVRSSESKGRKYPEPQSETRTYFQRDRDRIIHSKAFRRLKHKTQVFIATISDHYRSRLTHTIEVAQISRHLARLLDLNEDLSETIALAHDLGHTPFGHSGERELNALMKEFGGFEHNLQSRRVVDFLERKYPNFPGLNLSYEVLEGLLKHSTPYDNPQANGDGFISLEAQVCNIADEIAYNNHDIDDGVRSTLITEAELFANVALWREAKADIKKEYQNLNDKELMHLVISHLITILVKDVVTQTEDNLKKFQVKNLADLQILNNANVVSFSPEISEKNQELRKYLFKNFYFHTDIYRMNKRGQHIIRSLFTAFVSDPNLLPRDYQLFIDNSQKERVVCDYIAGMTDTYAKQELEQIASHTNFC